MATTGTAQPGKAHDPAQFRFRRCDVPLHGMDHGVRDFRTELEPSFPCRSPIGLGPPDIPRSEATDRDSRADPGGGTTERGERGSEEAALLVPRTLANL